MFVRDVLIAMDCAGHGGVTPHHCELDNCMPAWMTPQLSWSGERMRRPTNTKGTYSRNALGTWKVSTSCASATTGAGGLVLPSDMASMAVREVVNSREAALGAFRQRKSFKKTLLDSYASF
jgi:hypothetical protein